MLAAFLPKSRAIPTMPRLLMTSLRIPSRPGTRSAIGILALADSGGLWIGGKCIGKEERSDSQLKIGRGTERIAAISAALEPTLRKGNRINVAATAQLRLIFCMVRRNHL